MFKKEAHVKLIIALKVAATKYLEERKGEENKDAREENKSRKEKFKNDKHLKQAFQHVKDCHGATHAHHQEDCKRRWHHTHYIPDAPDTGG
jgi:hypothetical protein